MKTTKLFFGALFCLTLVTSCSDDDSDPVLEVELITDVILTFTNNADATNVVTLTNDAPEGQSSAATNTVVGKFRAGAEYSLTIAIENDGEDVLDEDIIPAADEHFIVYATNGIDFTMSRDDDDTVGAEGQKLGLKTTWTAGTAGMGSIRIQLIHEPTSADDSDGFGSGEGEDDFNITFDDVEIENIIL